MIYETPPFSVGSTHPGTDADANLKNHHLEGAKFTLPDLAYGATGNSLKGLNSGYPLTVVLIRNTSGGALLPGRFVQLERDTSNPREYAGRANGYTTTLRQRGAVLVDPFLASAGVANNDFFMGFVGGFAVGKSPTIGADFNGDIAAHAEVVLSTAAGTTTTAAGRVANAIQLGGNTATQALEAAMGMVGWALTARTTGETDTDILLLLKGPALI